METKNKVMYGLSNCYYAKITDTGTSFTYGTPVPLKGGVSLSISPIEEETIVAADNEEEYFRETINLGYEGDLEVVLLPDSFKTDILGEVYDATTGTYTEDAKAKRSNLALIFQFEGDVNAKRYVLYNCRVNRPKIESNTSHKKEPKTQTLSLKAKKHPYIGKVKNVAEAGGTAYETWFTTVFIPGTSGT